MSSHLSDLYMVLDSNADLNNLQKTAFYSCSQQLGENTVRYS